MRVSGNSDVRDYELIVVRHSERAVLVKDTEFSDPVWLPKSQVAVDANATGVAVVTIPMWLATEKGLA